ncbi:hypothetical protein EYW49_08315 [Siculibacillus lacustris]|uniref:Uncharacterized protein n=1 Tax=Siculibacillus lacustris TaxID=1549641 RepID=A0A4Q9VU84_9HYPH|nr:hypothetical protein [Siculibacillus lacustris]TBW38693.1 hypothetical protein EYW49_08315 [Siculibacillus lacustris]
MPRADSPIVCYDLDAISKFFRSVAMAIALQRHSQMTWHTKNDSTVLNIYYSLLFWKEPPGTFEIETSSRREIQDAIDHLHQQFMFRWIDELNGHGPKAAHAYVDWARRERKFAHDAFLAMGRDTTEINRMVVAELEGGIANMAMIELAATVGIAAIGLGAPMALAAIAAEGGGVSALCVWGLSPGASGLAYGAVSTGFSMGKALVKTWEDATSASVAAVSFEAGKGVTSELGGRASEYGGHLALQHASKAEQIIKSAEGLIRQHSERLGLEGLRRAAIRKSQGILRASTEQAARQQGVLTQASRLATGYKIVGKAFPVVFAAWDVLDGIRDYNETMAQLAH